MDEVDYKVDMMEMPFDNESIYFFICSHVLEHVESDDKAIQELFRITKKGGFGILVAPIILGLEFTVEDPNVTDEAGRWKLYGQGDHLRLYAHDDYVNKIKSHGFSVEQLGENYFGSRIFRELGLSSSSILYIVHKSTKVD
jgi:ubiquinone/menaquinone biosynthesis C-methylase UbiE